MSESQSTLAHLPFFEALATADGAPAEWNAISAGLVTLRLVDAWVADGPRAVAADAWGVQGVRQAIAEMGDGNAARGLLEAIVESMRQAPRARVATVAPRLMAYGRALRVDGRFRLAVDVYRTVLAHAHPIDDADLVVQANLQLAICFRRLAEWDEAAAATAAALQVATLNGDLVGVLRCRVVEAKMHMERGNLPEAQRILDHTIEEANRLGLREVRSVALHDRAAVAHLRGEFESAVRLAYRALRGYAEQADRETVLGDLGAMLFELGLRDSARDSWLILAATAQLQETRWMATINLLELAAVDGCELAFEQYRRELSAAPLSPRLATSFQFELGRGYHVFQRLQLAVAALERAVELATRYQLHQLRYRAERCLQDVRDGGVIIIAAPERARAPDALSDVTVGIRQMREMAGVG